MVPSWYAPNVAFTDPLTSLVGVESYRNNVDMLAGRTMLGQILFNDASIILHSVTGGDVTTLSEGMSAKKEGGVSIDNIVTRWTLRVSVKVLPWKPEAIFSGVSIYTLQPGGTNGVLISSQQDYWDSINIKQSSSSSSESSSVRSIPIPVREQYHKVDKTIALQDFLGQLKPDGFRAAAAAPELPYLLLRRGNGYEIRRYPTYIGIETTYDRRDVGYGVLGAFAGKNMGPLAPSIMKVYDDDDESTPKEKQMTWPLRYAVADEDFLDEVPEDAIAKAGTGQWKSVSLPIKPGRVVAVRTFEDAAIGPAVRAADRELRTLLLRDGGIGGTLIPAPETKDYVEFAQYDAIHSMGKRRTEVWIELSTHPF